MIRPRGLYAVMEHRGPYQSLPRAYEALLMFIRQNGYTVTGHGYESDLLGYAAVRRDEDYMVQIAIGGFLLGAVRPKKQNFPQKRRGFPLRETTGMFYNVISYQIDKGRIFVQKRIYLLEKEPAPPTQKEAVL